MQGARPLINGEIARLSAALPSQRDRALLYLGVGTGFRINELLQCKLSHLFYPDWKPRPALRLRVSKTRGRSEWRTVPIPKRAIEHCRKWLYEHPDQRPGAFMFISRKGNTAITSRHALRILSDAARSAGLPAISTHTLRKTFADRLYDRLDGNVFEVQQALGHKSPASTIRYLGFKEKRVESAILSLFDEEDQLPLPGVAEEEYPYGHE